MAGQDAEGDKRRGIQSVEIGLRVLSAVAAQREPSSLSVIANASGLSASQAHRYLASLMATGMVRQDGRAGSYDLDVGAIRIGLSALSRLDPFAEADEVCRALVASTKRTCMLSVWGDVGPVVVRWFAGEPAVTCSLHIGSTMPVLNSATGRIFLAFGDHAATAEHVRREARALGRKAADVEPLRKSVAEGMVAQIQGDLIPGLRAHAAPVFDLQGQLLFSVTLIANAGFSPDGDPTAEEALVSACQHLTESLGGSWNTSPKG